MRTLKDLIKSNTDELSFGGYTEDMLQAFAKKQIKYLEKQMKLHGKWVAQGVGENPSFKLPKGFDFENCFALPYGYYDVIKWIKRTFNLEVEK